MQSYKLAVKFFVDRASAVKSDEFARVFHSWIQNGAIKDHLLIDVADYQHVVGGPGTVLVAHEANFSMDRKEGKLGLMYTRKQPASEEFFDRLKQAFAACLQGCGRLEADTQRRFKAQQCVVR